MPGEKTKGERGRTKIAIQEPWNSAFLTSRRGPVRSTRNAGRKGGPRQHADRSIARKYRCDVIHWVFLSIGIRDLHRDLGHDFHRHACKNRTAARC